MKQISNNDIYQKLIELEKNQSVYKFNLKLLNSVSVAIGMKVLGIIDLLFQNSTGIN